MKKKIFISLGILVVALGFLLLFLNKTTGTIRVTRVVEQPVDFVWQNFTSPELMKQWWSPKNFTAPVIENDARTGGRFLFSMQAPDGKISYNSGTYVDVIPQKKIVSEMAFSDEKGNPVPASTYGIPGDWPPIVRVTVEFKDMGRQTEITVTEEGIPRIMSIFAKMGWEQQFDKFEILLQPQ